MAVTALLVHDGLFAVRHRRGAGARRSVARRSLHAYLEGLNDNREEMYLMLLIAAAGGLVLVGARHMVRFSSASS